MTNHIVGTWGYFWLSIGIDVVDKGSSWLNMLNKVKATCINHPPVITIFIGGMNHQKWG